MILGNVDIVTDISKEDFQNNYFKSINHCSSRILQADGKLLINGILILSAKKPAGRMFRFMITNQPMHPKAPTHRLPIWKWRIILIRSERSLLICVFSLYHYRPSSELLKNFTYPDLGIKFSKGFQRCFSEAVKRMYWCIMMWTWVIFCIFTLKEKKNSSVWSKQSAFIQSSDVGAHGIWFRLRKSWLWKVSGIETCTGLWDFMEHGDALLFPEVSGISTGISNLDFPCRFVHCPTSQLSLPICCIMYLSCGILISLCENF